MSRRNWKRIQPTSLRHALELCKDFAKERHNLSVERIAERMGLTDHWTVYKWIQRRGLPAQKVGWLWRFRRSDVDRWLQEQGRGRKA